MFWNRLPAFLRTVRFRLAAAYTLSALLAAVLTVIAMLLFQQHALLRGFDRSLVAFWERYSATPGDFSTLPPDAYAAWLGPDGRTPRTLSPSASGREQLFFKPHYGRRGDPPDARGFHYATVETGPRRNRYRVCARRLPDGSLFAVALGLEAYDRSVIRMLAAGGVGLGLMAVLLTVFGSLLAKRFMRGFDRAVVTVTALAGGDFSQRLEDSGEGEELTRLSCAVNTMAANTEGLLADLRAVTDNIAHDLRTPITRLRGRAELALYSSDARDLAGEVAEECDTMLELIGAMLEIARLAHNIGVGPGTPTDVGALVDALADLFSAAAEAKGVTLARQLPAEPLVCVANAPLLRRALANLTDNAVKFTSAGGSVTLGVYREGAALRFEVADTGCGIERSEQSRVFDRFYRSDTSRTLPGFGLGLSLVRAIAQALGGRVWANSAPGRGSVFVLELPFRGA